MNAINLKQALVMGLVTGLLAVIAYVLKVGDVFALEVHALVNCFAIAGLTAVGSFLTNLMTTSSGKFLGAVSIKDVY